MKSVKLLLLLMKFLLLMMMTSAMGVTSGMSNNLTTTTTLTTVQPVSHTIQPVSHFTSKSNVDQAVDDATEIEFHYAFNHIKAGSYIKNLNVQTLLPGIDMERATVSSRVRWQHADEDLFTLEPDGRLYANKDLDQKNWCTPTKCSEILVKLSSRRNIILQRSYENRNYPVLAGQLVSSIPGKVKMGDTIAVLVGTDVDEFPYNEVKVSVSPDSLLKHFIGIKKEKEFVRVVWKLNNNFPRELIGRSEYSTRFVIEDNGPGDSKKSFADVKFKIESNIILDVFCGPQEDGKIPETFDVRKPVCKVDVWDDRRLNSNFSYSVSHTNFRITSEGNIFAKKSFDAEEKFEYDFEVTACVAGSTLSCETKHVLLNIEDINEHRPVFNTNTLTIETEENTKIGNIIGKVIATDEDEQNDTITYRLGNYKDQFDIDEKTGEIKLLESLDYEETSLYQLAVWAMDHGIPKSHKTKATVEIKVIDVNDNRPTFIHPIHNDQTFLATIGQKSPIIKFQAEDGDSKQLGAVTYRLNRDQKSSEVFKLFKLDETTGELTFKSNHPPLKDAKSVPLSVQVYDGGVPPLSDDLELIIEIGVPNTANVHYTVGVIVGSIVVLVALVLFLYAMIKTNKCSKFYETTQEQSEDDSEESAEQDTDNVNEEDKSYDVINEMEERPPSTKLTVVSATPSVRSESRNSKVDHQACGSGFVKTTMTSVNGYQEQQQNQYQQQPGFVKDENGKYRYEPMLLDPALTPSCSSVGYRNSPSGHRNSPMNGNHRQGTPITSTYMSQPMQPYQSFPDPPFAPSNKKPYPFYPYEDTARLLNSHIPGYDGLGDKSKVHNHPTYPYQACSLAPVIEGEMLNEQTCYYPGAYDSPDYGVGPGKKQRKVTKSESAV